VSRELWDSHKPVRTLTNRGAWALSAG
jgi:hypothetical protein